MLRYLFSNAGLCAVAAFNPAHLPNVPLYAICVTGMIAIAVYQKRHIDCATMRAVDMAVEQAEIEVIQQFDKLLTGKVKSALQRDTQRAVF